jgi:aminoglycoside 2''-phosphotransferase
MDKTGRYLQQIHAFYPNLEVKTVRLNEQGQFNDGLILNDRYIFRFPKVPEALKSLHLEYEILCNIQEYLTLPIPNPIWSNFSTGTLGEAFIGYHLIPGQPFWRETYLAIKYEAIIHYIAVQIATFLQQLHSIPITAVLSNTLPLQDTRSDWAKLYLQFREQLFPYLKNEDRDRVTNTFAAFVENADNFNYQPVLRHGDFGTVNLLFDEETQIITGVIDFGQAALGDPALDFAAIMAPFGYSESFVRRFEPIYPIDESTLTRARFYVSTFALKEALYGILSETARAFESGMARYRLEADIGL